MIAAQLIVRASVGRPQKDTLEARTMWLDAKGDADEAAHVPGSIPARDACNFRLDHTVLEIGTGEDRDRRGRFLLLDEPHSLPIAIDDNLYLDRLQLQFGQTGQRKNKGLRASHAFFLLLDGWTVRENLTGYLRMYSGQTPFDPRNLDATTRYTSGERL